MSDDDQHDQADDELLELLDRVAAVRIVGNPRDFPANASEEWRRAAIDVLEHMSGIADEAGLGELELDDLADMVRGFRADGDARRYAACAAIFDWVVFLNERRSLAGQGPN